MLFAIPTLTFGQKLDQLFQNADVSYFDKKDYQTALELYKGIKAQLKSTDKDYPYTVNKIATSLFNLEQEADKKDDFSKSLEFSNEFIDLIDVEAKYIEPKLAAKKYWMYKNIIVAYFGLDQRDKAKSYQDKLYDAYKNKQLPEGINEYYNFEKFVYNNQNVWGYEWFAALGDKETKGSFSKQIYYVYSRDDKGNNKDQLFTLETAKVKKLKNTEPDFVLTKRFYSATDKLSESIWSSTFNNPVDYIKLHNAVVDYLKGNAK